MFSHESAAEVQFVMFTDCSKHTSASALIHRQTIYCYLLDLYTNKTEQNLRTLSYWALMKHKALLTIQAKLKLAIILFYFSVAIYWQIPRKRVARGARKL